MPQARTRSFWTPEDIRGRAGSGTVIESEEGLVLFRTTLRCCFPALLVMSAAEGGSSGYAVHFFDSDRFTAEERDRLECMAKGVWCVGALMSANGEIEYHGYGPAENSRPDRVAVLAQEGIDPLLSDTSIADEAMLAERKDSRDIVRQLYTVGHSLDFAVPGGQATIDQLVAQCVEVQR